VTKNIRRIALFATSAIAFIAMTLAVSGPVNAQYWHSPWLHRHHHHYWQPGPGWHHHSWEWWHHHSWAWRHAHPYHGSPTLGVWLNF
jgi:hypothetical protein